MRRVWILCALTAGCSSVAGLDEYCLLEDDAPADARCRVTPDSCGCPSGETCRAASSEGEPRTCGSVGALPTNALCGDVSACGASMTCWGWREAGTFHCRAYCEDDADCVSRQGAGSYCDPVRDTFSVCTKPCTPGRDDTDCGGGLACDVTSGGAGACRLAGTAALDEHCDSSTQCQRGLSCKFATNQDDTVCFRICGPGMTVCGDASCLVVEADGVRPAASNEWGVCGFITDT